MTTPTEDDRTAALHRVSTILDAPWAQSIIVDFLTTRHPTRTRHRLLRRHRRPGRAEFQLAYAAVCTIVETALHGEQVTTSTVRAKIEHGYTEQQAIIIGLGGWRAAPRREGIR